MYKSSTRGIYSDNINEIDPIHTNYCNEAIELMRLRALWRAVILQSVLDIVNNSSRTEEKIARRAAHSWLFDNYDDFITVCNIAEYSPDYVRRKAKDVSNKYDCKSKKWQCLLTKNAA